MYKRWSLQAHTIQSMNSHIKIVLWYSLSWPLQKRGGKDIEVVYVRGVFTFQHSPSCPAALYFTRFVPFYCRSYTWIWKSDCTQYCAHWLLCVSITWRTLDFYLSELRPDIWNTRCRTIFMTRSGWHFGQDLCSNYSRGWLTLFWH